MKRRLVIFTDLDGTLLDHDTYSFSAASEALDAIRRQEVPLVLCSSKTRAEIELLQEDLRLRHPFISENGGAIFVPPGYFSGPIPEAKFKAGYQVLEYGTPYPDLVRALHQAAARTGVEVIGFSDMTVEEVARDCQMSLLEARLAKLREYDEPFRFGQTTPAGRSRFFDALHRTGLRCTSGGRYHHLTGVTDKGRALRKLKTLYEAEGTPILTVGLGDSLNDLGLLREVNIPVVVQNSATTMTDRLLRQVPRAILTREAGPRGWNQAVLETLARRTAAVS
jgi:mannosyl-3-phosphoglycerate phosphatase